MASSIETAKRALVTLLKSLAGIYGFVVFLMYAPDVADCIYALGCLTLALRPTLPWLNLGCFFSAALKNRPFAVPKDRRISGESKGTPVPLES